MFTWNGRRELAAVLLARGITTRRVADQVGITKRQLMRWCKQPEFIDRRCELDPYYRPAPTLPEPVPTPIQSPLLARGEYEARYAEQDGRCAICGVRRPGRHEVRGDKRCLVVDHDHATRRVRGLLCQSCNSGIGLLGDDVERLGRAIEYLTGNVRAELFGIG